MSGRRWSASEPGAGAEGLVDGARRGLIAPLGMWYNRADRSVGDLAMMEA